MKELKDLCVHTDVAETTRHYSLCRKCLLIRFAAGSGTVRGYNQSLAKALGIPYYTSDQDLTDILSASVWYAIIEHETVTIDKQGRE